MDIKFRIFAALAVALFPLWSSAQVEDDFSDGNFTENPVWSGSTDLFTVAPYPLDESNLMLRSNSPGAANYYLSTPSSIVAETSWEFFVNARFSLSGANFIDAWLVADNADLTDVQNGYFIRIGRTQRDITFWKKSGGTDQLLIDGPDNMVNSGSNNPVEMRITRNADGFWSIQADPGVTGLFQTLGFVVDDEITDTEAFGFRITQSGAQGPINAHWFDAVAVTQLPPDVTPPTVVNAAAPFPDQIILDFDEPLDAATAEITANYTVDGGIGNPTDAVFDTENLTRVTLTLPAPLDDGQFYTLNVAGVEDLAGNAMPGQDVEVIFFTVSEPGFREIVFNELMIDENPPVELPAVEFIELYNTTADKFFDLEGYTYVNGNDTRTLDAAVIFPGEYLLLCRASEAPFMEPFGDVLGLVSWPLLTNGADSLALINGSGELVDAVAYTIDWYQDPDKSGGGWTLEQINPFDPCSGQHNWRASDDPAGGTPGQVNSIFDDSPDTEAPEVTGFESPADDILRLLFSKPMDAGSLESGTYTFDQGVEVLEVMPRFDLLGVNLTLNQPLEVGVTYTLTLTGLQDCAGNSLPDGTEVEILTGEAPEFMDLVITEIMADPTPAVGLPPQEYIEIFNASDKVIDIQGCDLSGRGFIFPRLVMPGEYVMLVSSNAADDFVDFPDAYIMQGMSLTFLTNAGRELTLTNQNGDLVNTVTYSNTWYGDPEKADGGWSLEIINPFTECSDRQNWSASEDPSGGTPGAENSIFDDSPDEEPPVFEGFFAETPETLVLFFNELMDAEALIEGIYAFSEGISVDSALPLDPPTAVQLNLSEPLQVGETYELTLSGLADCSLNPMPDTTFIVQIGVSPELHEVIISEIMADPTPAVGLPPEEYFELYNRSDRVIELLGCDLSGRTFTNPRLLQPGEYLLCVGASQVAAFAEFDDVYIIEGLSATFLTNSGRELLLTNPDGDRVDRVDYRVSWYNDASKDGGGWSLERMNLDEPCRGSANWTASEDPLGGTPGRENSVNTDDPDLDPPNITIALAFDPTDIEVRFDEVIDPESVALADFDLNGIGVIDAQAVTPDNKAVRLTLGAPLQPGKVYTLKLTGLADCVGNMILDEAEVRLAVPQIGEPGDILINEVLFNSGNDGVDFIEIVNVSDKSVGLEGWQLQNVNLITRIITEDPMVIFPGDYMVFTSDPDQLMVQYPLGRRETFVTVNTPQLTNAGGSVILNNSLGMNIDRFDYSEDYHLSLLRSLRGVALERISFTRPTNDGGNWSSAAEQVGFGTPGYLNSQFLPEGEAAGTFELQNEVFSPDNDGFQDVLLINYKLDNPGFIATIQIFDRRGRRVRQLVNNQIIGTQGTISWDGTTDTRTKARIGPHIVLVELFDLDGNTKVFKLPCVVAGRLGN